MMSRRQFRPEPTLPIPLFPPAQASDATCVPWPTWSVVAGPSPGVASLSIVSTILPCRSGCPLSTPVSMTATIAPSPRVISQAAGRSVRATHQATVVPAGVPDVVSGVLSAGSLGAKRRLARCSTSTARTPGSRRSVPASTDSPMPPTGRTLTRPICGTCAPSRRTPLVASTAAVAARAAFVACGASSVTSSRPVVRGAAAWAADGTATKAAASARDMSARRRIRSRARTSRLRSSSPATRLDRTSSRS